MRIVIIVIFLSVTFSNSKHLKSNQVRTLVSVSEDVSTKLMFKTDHYEIFDSFTNATNIEDLEEDKDEKENKRATFSEILQYCVIVLLIMFILMLLSEWADLSELLQTSRHHMIIIQM